MSAADSPLAVDLKHVAKTYGRRVSALRGIALEVRRGEVFGLLGPNGAGKSTLVKILMTVVRPTRAEGTVLGRPVGHRPTLARIGYLPEHHRLPPYLTGRQALEYYGALGAVGRDVRRRRAEELINRVGLRDRARFRVSTYSKGMQQRIGLAQALMNDPDLVVLDEPTDGLDPIARKEVRELLLELRGRGKTVFLNSHLLGEVEQVCDRVAILVAGQVVHQGTIAAITARQRRYEIEVAAETGVDLARAVAAACPPELGMPVCWTGRILEVATADPRAVQPVIDRLRAAGLILLAVRPVQQSLEDFFVEAVSARQGGG